MSDRDEPEVTPAGIGGGQGRSAQQVESSAWCGGIAALALVIFLIILAALATGWFSGWLTDWICGA